MDACSLAEDGRLVCDADLNTLLTYPGCTLLTYPGCPAGRPGRL